MEPSSTISSGSPSSQEDANAGVLSPEDGAVTSEVELRRPLDGAPPVGEAGTAEQGLAAGPERPSDQLEIELARLARYSGVRSGISLVTCKVCGSKTELDSYSPQRPRYNR